MTQSTFPTAGTRQPYGQPYGGPGVGGPFGQPAPPFGQPAPPFGYQQPPKRRTGLIVGSILGTLVIVAGLVVGALLLFGTKTLDRADAQRQVTDLGQQLIGAAPENVSCPANVEVRAGGSFTCTATLEGQDISFTVKLTDDQGSVEVTTDNTFVKLSDVENDISTQVEAAADRPVTVDTTCDAGGRTILVDPAGTSLNCTVSNADDPSQSAAIVATVGENGSATIESVQEN